MPPSPPCSALAASCYSSAAPLSRGPRLSLETAALVAPLVVVGVGLSLAPATSASRGWALGLTFLCFVLLGPAFLLGCLLVSRRHGLAQRACWVCFGAVVALGKASLAVYAAALLTDGGAYAAARPLMFACLAAGVVGGTGNLLVRMPALRTEPGAAAPLLLLGGTAVGLNLFVAAIVLPRLTELFSVPPQVAAGCLAVLPISYAYAVRRHRLLGLPSMWDRRLTRVVGAAILALGYLALLRMLPTPWALALPDDPLVLTLPAFLLGLSVVPLTVGAARSVDRVLFHDAYSHERALQHLVESLGAAADVLATADSVLGQVRGWLDLVWIAIIRRHGEHWSVIALATMLSTPSRARLIRALTAGYAHPPAADGLRPAAVATFPLQLGSRTEAVLLAGPKANGERLRRGDRALLAALAASLGPPLGRADLLVEAQERVAELERHRLALRGLRQRLRNAQEQERTRLSTGLHEGALQQMHYLLRLLDAHAPVDTCRDVATRATAELRSACVGLRPAALGDLGLPAALTALARRMEPWAGCPIHVGSEGCTHDTVAPETQLALYRIAQEALANCARHAGASEIVVSLGVARGEATLAVRDDGMGFELGAAARDGVSVSREHLGLLEMQECARSSGGALTVTSSPGFGTTINAVVPCAPIGEVEP